MENVSTTRILRFSLTFTLGNDNYHEKIGEISVTGTEKAKKKILTGGIIPLYII